MFKFKSKLLKYLFPFLLIAIVGVEIFGFISPWEPAEKVLGPELARSSLLIGAQYNHRSSNDKSYDYIYRKQTYILFPGSLTTMKTFSVVQENGNVRTEENPLGLIVFILACIGLGVGTWWYWIRE